MVETDFLSSRIPDTMGGQRLDRVLAVLFPQYSRTRIQRWVRLGKVRVNKHVMRNRDKITGGEWVEIEVVNNNEQDAVKPENLPLDIVYQDDAMLVINKPAGIVVHPAVGNRDGTLLNALLYHLPEVAVVPRGGIVHRLDKDTSGLMVVARTVSAHHALVRQIQERSVEREYDAVVFGELIAGGSVVASIGRHPVNRKRMAVIAAGRSAVTHYRIAHKLRGYTHLRVRLETGRTHQIRVHMAHIHHPLVGDPVYAGRLRLPSEAGKLLAGILTGFKRQALHASRLKLSHPNTGAVLEFKAPLPADMQVLIQALQEYARGKS